MRKIFGWLILFFAIAINFGNTAKANDIQLCGGKNTSPDERIQSCSRLINSGRLRGKQLGVAYGLRAVGYGTKREYDLSIADLNIALNYSPNDGTLYSNRCAAYVELHQNDRAVTDCEHAIRLLPKLANAHGNLCVTQNNQGHFAVALDVCNRAIELDPGNALLYLNRCLSYGKLSKFDRAVTDCEHATRIAPQFALAYSNLCWFQFKQGQFAPALDNCNRAIQLDPELANSYVNRCAIFSYRNDWERAVADCDRAVALSPRLASAYNARCGTLRGKGDLDGAMADCDKAISLDSNQDIAYVARCSVWSDMGKLDQALQDCNRALRINPQSTVAYLAKGFAFLKTKDLANAMAEYNHGLQIDPASASLLNGRCYASATLGGDLNKALTDCNEAIRLVPDYGQAFDSRCAVFLKLKYFDDALSDCNRAIRLLPESPHPLVRRGLINETKGEREQARADFNQALTLTSGDPWPRDTAREHLAALSVVALEPRPVPTIATAATGRRVALVLDNSNYRAVPSLPNPRRDALAVAAALRSVGFQVVTVETDVGKEAMFNALRSFAREADSAEWALVYLAGHGVEVNGVNYFIPVDAKLATDRDVEFETVSLAQVLASVEGAKKLKLIILDACRDNPFIRQMRRSVATRSVGRGLARIEPDAGSLVVYSAKAGETALDGTGSNSPFAAALIKEMRIPGIEIRRLFDLVRDDVMEATGRQRQPYTYGSVSGRQDFFFVQK